MGKSKKPKIEVTEYFLSHHLGICHAMPDALLQLIVKEKAAWSGYATALSSYTINQKGLFGGIKKEGGVSGVMHYLPGDSDQVLPDALAQKLGRSGGADCPGFRGLASLFFVGNDQPGFYWTANTPYLPGIWATVQRVFKRSDGSAQWYSAKAGIAGSTAVTGEVIQPYNATWEYQGAAIQSTAPDEVPSSGWSASGQAPFGIEDGPTFSPPYPPATAWAASTGIWLRRTFTCDSGLIIISGKIENACYVYIDGVLVGSQNPGNANVSSLQDFSIGVSISSGAHEIAIYATDDTVAGVNTYLYAQIDRAEIGRVDMNPAHIIHECLTDTQWGMGTPVAALDDAAFMAAADTLYDENFGLSLLWTRQTSIQDFVQEILDHIQGVLYVDPATGLLTLSLIRDDYDAGTLDVIDPDNADLSNFSRKLWGDIVNEIVVTWTNPENEQEETITVQDDSSIAIQGGIVSDSRNYYGVRTAALAQDLAYRDLRSAGQPLASCQAEVDRSQWGLRPASVIKLTWPEYGLSELVMRVQSIDYGKPGDPTIKLALVEDVFGLDVGSYDEPPTTEWVDPSADPEPIETVDIFTLPYFFALGTSVAAFVESPEYPEVVAGILATTDSEDTYAYELWDEVALPNGSTEWQSLGTLNVIGYGELASDLDAEVETASASFDDVIGNTSPTLGGFVIIGDQGEAGNEIALINADDGDYDLVRGVLDTIPRAWPAGTPVWFVNEDTVYEDSIVRSAAETVDYKLLSQTSQGTLYLEDAPVESQTLTERPWLPNRPANVTAYGEAWSSAASPIDAISRADPWVTVGWAIRNRLDEDALVLAWDDASGTAESGQTTTIEVRAADGTLLTTHDGLAGTSYDVPDASFGSESLVRIRVYSERSDADGDFVSLQYFEHWVQVGAATFDSTSVTFDSSSFTMDQE